MTILDGKEPGHAVIRKRGPFADIDNGIFIAMLALCEAVKRSALNSEDAFLMGLAVGATVSAQSPLVGRELRKQVELGVVAGGKEREAVADSIDSLAETVVRAAK